MEHGLRNYRGFGCRCEICKMANRDYMRRYRAGERVAFPQRTDHQDEFIRVVESVVSTNDARTIWVRLRRAGFSFRKR